MLKSRSKARNTCMNSQLTTSMEITHQHHKRGKGPSSYTSKYFFCTSKIFLNSPNTLWPFKKTHGHHTSKIFPEVKMYHRKSTSENQNISPEVDFQKSKIITGSRLPKIKKHYRKSTSENQKTLRKLTSVSKIKSILNIFYFF